MQVRHTTGPRAGAVKYDVLSALLVLAAQGAGVEARLALRLSLLITARYNWRSGIFCVGQREMARMWGVTERTAKREMAAMRVLGWIVVARPAARGRVAEHSIDFAQVLISTRPLWPQIGPDFEERMTTPASPALEASNVVPLRPLPAPVADGSLWAATAGRLAKDHPATYSAWFAQLIQVDHRDGILILGARSVFVADYVQQHLVNRIQAEVVRHDQDVRLVKVIAISE